MTPDEIRARCIRFVEDDPMALPWHEEPQVLRSTIEFANEMIAIGLERAATIAGEAADDYIDLGSPQGCSASERIEETCRTEAQKLKELRDQKA